MDLYEIYGQQYYHKLFTSSVHSASYSLVFVGLAVFLYVSLNCLQMSCWNFVCIAYSVTMVDCAQQRVNTLILQSFHLTPHTMRYTLLCTLMILFIWVVLIDKKNHWIGQPCRSRFYVKYKNRSTDLHSTHTFSMCILLCLFIMTIVHNNTDEHNDERKFY